MPIFKLFNLGKLGFLALGLCLLGASCSIGVGQPANSDGGMYRSDNHGRAWKQKSLVQRTQKGSVTINETTARALLIDPKNSQRLWLGTLSSGLWRSLDAGEHWQATSLKTGRFSCIEADPLNTEILYTVSGTQAYTSTNGGKNWKVTYTESQPNQTLDCLAVDPSRSNVIWIYTSGGKLLQSIDFGQHWSLTGVFTKTAVTRMIVDRSVGAIYLFTPLKGILKIEPDGKTVTLASTALKPFRGSNQIHDVAIPPNNHWYLSTGAGLLHSPDQGQTWDAVPTLLAPKSPIISNLIVNPVQPSEMWLTVGRKLHHTVDTGQTWEVSILPSSREPTVLTIDPNNVDRLYVGTIKPVKKK